MQEIVLRKKVTATLQGRSLQVLQNISKQKKKKKLESTTVEKGTAIAGKIRKMHSHLLLIDIKNKNFAKKRTAKVHGNTFNFLMIRTIYFKASQKQYIYVYIRYQSVSNNMCKM